MWKPVIESVLFAHVHAQAGYISSPEIKFVLQIYTRIMGI